MNTLEQAKRCIIQECKEDMVSIWFAMRCVQHKFPDMPEDWIRTNTLRIIGEILEEEDWIHFVSLSNEQFERWDSTLLVIAHIDEQWAKLGHQIMSPDIGWLSQWPI